MLGLLANEASPSDSARIQVVSLPEIAGLERPLDPTFLTDSRVNSSFLNWLQNRMGMSFTENDGLRKVWSFASL